MKDKVVGFRARTRTSAPAAGSDLARTRTSAPAAGGDLARTGMSAPADQLSRTSRPYFTSYPSRAFAVYNASKLDKWTIQRIVLISLP